MLRQRRQEDLPWFFHISADLFDRIDNIRQLSIVLADLCAVFLFQFIVPPGGIELRVEPSRIRDLCDEHRGLYIEIPVRAGIGGLVLTFGDITITSVACALILGIIVNLIVNIKKGDGAAADTPTAKTADTPSAETKE